MLELMLATLISVYDGDTLRVDGTPYRLVDYDTPERRGQCKAEKKLALEARERLIQLVKEPTARLQPVPCTGYNFGRLCGRLFVNNVNASTIMIKEGLARSYHCDNNRCPKRESWCK